MPVYTVLDEQTGKTITFEWAAGIDPPTDADMEDVFQAARQDMPEEQQPAGFVQTAMTEMPSAQSLSNVYRPVLEGGGATAGALVGAASPLGPYGAVVGGMGGYATGKAMADTADIALGLKQPYGSAAELWGQTTKDLAMGGLYESGGLLLTRALEPVIAQGGKVLLQRAAGAAAGAGVGYAAEGKTGAVIGGIAGAVGGPAAYKQIVKAVSTPRIQKEAGKILVANMREGALIAKTSKEAIAIADEMERVTGQRIKWTLGQLTNEPGIIALERPIVKGGAPEAAQAMQDQIAHNNRVIRRYFDDIFPEREGIENVMDAVRSRQAGLGQTAETAEQAARAARGRMPQAGPEVTGQRAIGALQEAKQLAKTEAGRLYGQIPAAEIPVSNVYDDFTRINQPKFLGEAKKNFPDLKRHFRRYAEQAGLVDDTGKALLPDNVQLNDLRGIRGQILEDARNASAGLKPNRLKASRLYDAADAISGAVERAEGDTGAAAILKRANTFYREQVVPFRQGTIGKIMARGPTGEKVAVQASQVPTRLWNKGNLSTADDFIQRVGFDNARAIMKDHAAYELLQKADRSGKVTAKALNGWLASNRPVLRKFGLENAFDDIVVAQQLADDAAKAAKAFEQTSAYGILGADPGVAIGVALTTKHTGKAMRELLNVVKGNAAAENGLRKAFADYAWDNIQRTAKDMAGDVAISNDKFVKLLRKYKPAMDELYRGHPMKHKALTIMQRAYEIGLRNMRPPVGGGSDTFELFQKMAQVNILSRTATIARGVFNLLGKYGKRQADAYVTRALLDPEYAQPLIDAVRGKIHPREFRITVEGQIKRLMDIMEQNVAASAAGAAAMLDKE